MGALPDDWALPLLTEWNRVWFTSGTLAVQACAACGQRQHPPEEVCHACGAMTFTYNAVAPTGVVHSFTVAHYAANRALADALPYTVVLVALDDAPGVRVLGNLHDADDVRIGLAVEAHWDERTDDDGVRLLLPQWHPR